jgi:hypothetical protein
LKPEDKLKLPDMERAEYLSSAFLRKEWVMDPPPFIWERLKDEVLINILKAKMKYLAEIARLEARAKEIESKMLEKCRRLWVNKVKKVPAGCHTCPFFFEEGTIMSDRLIFFVAFQEQDNLGIGYIASVLLQAGPGGFNRSV